MGFWGSHEAMSGKAWDMHLADFGIMHAGYKPEQRDLLKEEWVVDLLFRFLIHLGLDHLI